MTSTDTHPPGGNNQCWRNNASGRLFEVFVCVGLFCIAHSIGEQLFTGRSATCLTNIAGVLSSVNNLTISFVPQYLQSEPLRREIHVGLNVVENWNSANSFISYGKGSEVASNRFEEQELSVLSLHLLQICLVYVNTLMIQQVLGRPDWADRMRDADRRAFSPLIYNHINSYGIIELNMDQRIALSKRMAA